MCGIVGLHLKDTELEPRLGSLLTPMLVALTTRGPDSAGIAIYDDEVGDGSIRFSLRAQGERIDWPGLGDALGTALSAQVKVRPIAGDAIIIVKTPLPTPVIEALEGIAPTVGVVSYGRCLEVYKDVGSPADIATRYGIPTRSGFQGVGHTRMATESAVTTEHSHPFAAGLDLCLVHNGSFSNHATVRRRLSADGITCDTDNDSEVAARFLAREIAAGADLDLALKRMMVELDGVYTLLVATDREFAVLRDARALKPAVLAETDGYVAMASEYHALAGLPDIEKADVFEPMPGEIHVWTR